MFVLKKIIGALLSPGVIILVLLVSGLVKMTFGKKSGQPVRSVSRFPGLTGFLFFYHSTFTAGIVISSGETVSDFPTGG
jgi:hypothetical protein